MKKFLRNIDIYITIVICLTVAILGIIGIVNQIIISSAVLAILAVLSYSLLSNRIENKSIKDELNLLIKKKSISDLFFEEKFDRTAIGAELKNSSSAFFLGFAFTIVIPQLKDIIEECLHNGGDIKFIIIQPKSSAAKMAAFRNRHQTEEEFNQILLKNIDLLKKIGTQKISGNLEIRTVDYLPPYTIIGFNANKPNGKIRVRLSTLKLINEGRPIFTLSKSHDTKWFSFFKRQFDTIWERASIIEI